MSISILAVFAFIENKLKFSVFKSRQALGIFVFACFLAACTGQQAQKDVPSASGNNGSVSGVPPTASAQTWQPANWSDIPAWPGENIAESWGAWRAGCTALSNRPLWRPVCEAAQALGDSPDDIGVIDFFRSYFRPWQLVNADGSKTGLVTGYYEPIIKGSRTKSAHYAWPIHGRPFDLVATDAPQLSAYNQRGRLSGDKLVPYWSRAEIDAMGSNFSAPVLFWAQDPIELFFMQVQGSGRIDLPDGSRVRVAFADRNGHPYQSIGRWLVDRGEMSLDKASMEGIKTWAKTHPQRVRELMNANPSYVFFKEQPNTNAGPVGALGVPLTEGRSIAVDLANTPLGAPVFLETTHPLSARPLERLMMAQDTGGAIKGGVRADFFWGLGPQAGLLAGKMRQQGRMWVLLPIGVTPPVALGRPSGKETLSMP